MSDLDPKIVFLRSVAGWRDGAAINLFELSFTSNPSARELRHVMRQLELFALWAEEDAAADAFKESAAAR